jgi:hypothetical protein
MVRVILNRAAVHVASIKAGEKIVRAASRDVARLARARAARGPYATGKLAASIRIRGPYVLFDSVRAQVGSPLRYAASVERGAERHVILPHGPYPLRFYWRKVGRVVRLSKVRHPGQKAKHYLLDSLREVAHARGMRIIP